MRSETKHKGLVILKLSSGEEIVGDLVDFTPGSYILKGCIAMMRKSLQEYVPIPWVPYTDGPVSVSIQHIMAELEPDEKIRQMYQSATSDIVVPGPGTTKQLLTEQTRTSERAGKPVGGPPSLRLST